MPNTVLVVDDFEAWRRSVCTRLRQVRGLQVIGEPLDGVEAVQKSEELEPDLIVLDIGLRIGYRFAEPKWNRRCETDPQASSKSENHFSQ